MDESGALAAPAPGGGLAEDAEARERVAAVDLAHEEMGERADEPRDASPRGLHLDRHRDGIAVVLDQVEDGELPAAGDVEALPELAFRRRPVPGRAVDDLVGGEWGRRRARNVARPEVEAGLGAADRLQELGAGRRGLGDDVEAGVAPVGGHLPSPRARVVPGPEGAEQHLAGRHPELQEEGAVAVVGVEPVVARPQDEAGRDLHRLVAGSAALEEDPVLALELDLPVVEASRQHHRAVDRQQRLAVEA